MKRARLKRGAKTLKKARLTKLRGEYELSDIFDGINVRNAEDVVAKNVAYVMKREKLLKRGLSVVVPAGGLVEFYEKSPDGYGFVQADFQIMKDQMDIVAGGTAYGQVANGELLDLTVEVYERG